MKPLKLVGPGQSITGKFVVEILGGLEKTNFPKNQNPPAGGGEISEVSNCFTQVTVPPPLAFGQSIIFNFLWGFSGPS